MTFFCSLCNVRLNTQNALCSHYESYSHHDKLLQYAKYLHQQEKQTDAIRNNNSDIIMATEENISDEEVRHRIDKVISNNDSLVNLTKKWNNDINIITLHYTKYLKINGIKISTDYSICYILDITILQYPSFF